MGYVEFDHFNSRQTLVPYQVLMDQTFANLTHRHSMDPSNHRRSCNINPNYNYYSHYHSLDYNLGYHPISFNGCCHNYFRYQRGSSRIDQIGLLPYFWMKSKYYRYLLLI